MVFFIVYLTESFSVHRMKNVLYFLNLEIVVCLSSLSFCFGLYFVPFKWQMCSLCSFFFQTRFFKLYLCFLYCFCFHMPLLWIIPHIWARCSFKPPSFSTIPSMISWVYLYGLSILKSPLGKVCEMFVLFKKRGICLIKELGIGCECLKIPYHAFLGLIIAFGGTTRIGLHACLLEKTPYYSRSVNFCKTNFSIFQNCSDLNHVTWRQL